MLAPSAFSMKFACFGEICAPPMRWPFSPQASSIRPALSSCSGFLKTLPKVRRFVGCAALRRAFSSRTVALISIGSRGREPELGPDDDLAVAQVGVPVREAELGRREPAGAVAAHDAHTLEHLGEVAAVRTAVHPDAAADRAGDRARELEAAEPGCAGAVQRDRVRRAAARAKRLALDGDGCEQAGEPQDERIDAVVGGEQVRAEADGRDGQAARRRPAQRLLDLLLRLGPREGARRAAGAERREAGELDAFFDVHASASSRSGPARSTSPAPSVSTVSPGRAHAATIATASSSSGAQPMRMPGRTRASSSTISRPDHARDRLLACRVDLGHADRVRRRERPPELVREVGGARVEVRLKEREHASLATDGGEVGRELGRMVRVAVEHGDAGRVAPALEPPSGAREVDDHALGVRARHARELERGERGRGVAAVVLAGNRELELARARASSARTTCGTCASQSSKRAATSARVPKVA